MLEETGTIVEIKDPRTAVVLCRKSSMCENCAARTNCHTGDDGDGDLRRIEAHNGLGAVVGDTVKIAADTRSFLQGSFLLYILPLIFLLIGAGAGQLLGQRFNAGPDPNLLAALLGILFLTLSFVGIRLGTRHLSADNFMPRITEILVAPADSNKGDQHGNQNHRHQ
ncbi:SoxR reducing system RseC family protein [Geoalkalibacter halelectricus]|uniref:SoxR reducing system RseC family protein n=1 Tax=Geoalkalibacter halelectricus TaxID=2847045 RepID=A0ABY5ZH75_9BACT|nr:SoxR reducing system RseC family protein [Geoalkalibacter halelectricus]MDO3376559.1 SoxR reducing system RseC family protein [Geoalkalibacter halelectricus]UWZ78477.1 SoxR reducing system RseC family protein [Geoalkalibacter halelectricus]